MVLNQAVSESNFSSYSTFFKEASNFLFRFYCFSKTAEDAAVFDSKMKLREFWALIRSDYESVVIPNISSIKLSRLKCMFSCVKTPSIPVKVIEETSLENTNSDPIEGAVSSIPSPLPNGDQDILEYQNFLSMEFSAFIKFTYEYYSNNQEIFILELLAFLLERFSCDHLYLLLSEKAIQDVEVTAPESTSEAEAVTIEVGSPRVVFLRDLFGRLVYGKEEEESEKWADSFISIFFTVYNELSKREKCQVLSQFQVFGITFISFNIQLYLFLLPHWIKCLNSSARVI